MTPDAQREAALIYAAQWLVEQTDKVRLPLDSDRLLGVIEELRLHELKNDALRIGATRARNEAEGWQS